ncbi:MAG TPA: response regulator [Phycisphaerae bacterium]|nr:response regulator [Phycisphaerae bacterium]
MPREREIGGTDAAQYESAVLVQLRSQLQAESSDSRKLLASPTDNPICSIESDDSLPGLVVVWRNYANSRQLRFVHEYLLQLIEKNAISKVLCDDTALRTIASDDQSWIIQDWIPRAIRAGLRAGAHTASSAHFAAVAVNALASAAPDGIALRVFETTAEARKWLQDYKAILKPDTPIILIVDDYEDTRNVLAHLLRREGYDAVTAPGPAEALAFLEKTKPSLVITDFAMLQTNGLMFFAQIRKDTRLRDVPVIMYSANDVAEKAARQAGIDAYVQKASMDWETLQREVLRLAGPGRLGKSLPDVPPARAKDVG